MSDKMWTLNNHLTEEQRPRVAEWLHMLGIERASFTAVQDLSGVRIEFRRDDASPADVGQCGNASPGNKLRITCGNLYFCSLPAGHAGWHQEDQARWGKSWSDEPDDALAVLRELVELRRCAVTPAWLARHRVAWDKAETLVAEHTPNEETPDGE